MSVITNIGKNGDMTFRLTRKGYILYVKENSQWHAINTGVDILKLRKAVETTDYNLLGITKNFTRRFSSYVKNKPQHLKASIWANNILGTKITHANNPLLFYVTSNCEDDVKPNQRNKAICILEEELELIDKNKDKFSIDYDTFFKKQVIEQLEEFQIIPQVKKALDEYEISINV